MGLPLRGSSDIWISSALQASDKLIEGLEVRNREQSNKGNIVVRIYYGLPDQSEQMNKVIFVGLR